jgi:hypothetical protein
MDVGVYEEDVDDKGAQGGRRASRLTELSRLAATPNTSRDPQHRDPEVTGSGHSADNRIPVLDQQIGRWSSVKLVMGTSYWCTCPREWSHLRKNQISIRSKGYRFHIRQYRPRRLYTMSTSPFLGSYFRLYNMLCSILRLPVSET